jgi:hypothetical protein
LKRASQNAGVEQDEKVRGIEGVGVYGNYASKYSIMYFQRSTLLTTIDTDVPASEIYGANAKKLEELKHKYDPDNLFDRGTRLVPRPIVVVN